MPAWPQLSDEEIAGTLNHLLTWGEGDAPPEFEAYTAEEIAPLRDEPLSPQDVHALRQTLELGE